MTHDMNQRQRGVAVGGHDALLWNKRNPLQTRSYAAGIYLTPQSMQKEILDPLPYKFWRTRARPCKMNLKKLVKAERSRYSRLRVLAEALLAPRLLGGGGLVARLRRSLGLGPGCGPGRVRIVSGITTHAATGQNHLTRVRKGRIYIQSANKVATVCSPLKLRYFSEAQRLGLVAGLPLLAVLGPS